MWYLSIWWSDLKTGNTVATIRISRSFLWYAINELMNVMQRQNHACNENKLMHVMQLWFLGYMDGHSCHSPWLNYECKIECLQAHFWPIGTISFWPQLFVRMPRVCVRMHKACARIHTQEHNSKVQPNNNQTKPNMLLIN